MNSGNIVLGKYIPKNTPIHKIDPRTKLFLMILLMVVVFVPYGSYVSTFIVDGIMLLLLILILWLARISFSSVFSSLKVLWMTVIFLLIVNIFIPNGTYTYSLCDWNGFHIYLEAIFQSIKIILRILLMILLTLIMTATTKPTDLSYAFEWYLSPLKVLHIPVAEFAMVISLTIRFIPTILEETLRLKKAQEARGVDFEHGNIGKRLGAVISLIVPLFITTLSRSTELAEALESRGYIPNAKRTRYNILSFTYRDLLSFALVCAVSAGFFYLSYYQYDILGIIFNFSNDITKLGA